MISITITGKAGKGKSTIAMLIAKFLVEQGFTTTLVDDNGRGVVDETPGDVEENFAVCVSSLKKKPPLIQIRTRQERRGK